MSQQLHDFDLENVAAGPDPFVLSDVAADPDIDCVVLLFQRDYHCPKCRRQVQDVADRYDEFEAAGAMVAAVLPEATGRARNWQESYDLPYPLLADPDADVSDSYDQPVRFGFLGSLHDMIGRMPVAVVLDTRDGDPTVAFVHEGKTPADRPSIDELLEECRSLGA